ncbi:hypothetical protein BC629DRAFT_931785 [Irpex lacteus]|nr:hypothetical protein BC629DRAFT_931785 [Irpex lacteus]
MPATMMYDLRCELMEHSASFIIRRLLITSSSAYLDGMAPANPHGVGQEDMSSRTLNQRSYTMDHRGPEGEEVRGATSPHSLTKRQGEDGVAPGPPPPYTPTIALHASTIPLSSPETATSIPTLLPTPPPALPAPATPSPHGTNVGLLAGAVVAAGITIVLLAAFGRYLVRRNAKKLSKSHPRFSMWLPKTNERKLDEEVGEKAKEEWADESVGQFVYISNSDGDLEDPEKEGTEEDQHFEEDQEFGEVVRTNGNTLHPGDLPPTLSRRFSAPGALEDFQATMPFNHSDLSSSMSAPASPNASCTMDRDTSLWIQRQKAAELAQIVRMRIVREDMPVHKAATSCPDLTERDDAAKRASVTINHGLGVVHGEQEVDISSTALTALESYSIAAGSMTPNIPLTGLFKIDKAGKVIRMSSPPVSPSQEKVPSSPVSPSTSGSSSLTEGSGDELESAVIVRMAQTRSMEIKRGTLVAMDLRCSPPVSRSAPMLLDTFMQVPPLPSNYFAPRSASAHGLSSPPPSLSPIIPSAASFTSDIEQSLEERVFAYRESGEWSRENYKLTTPGQVRALVEALSISRPVSVQGQTDRGWPWPAHRQE